MAPQVGLEPTTLRLTAGCSAIELLRSVVSRTVSTHNNIGAADCEPGCELILRYSAYAPDRFRARGEKLDDSLHPLALTLHLQFFGLTLHLQFYRCRHFRLYGLA